jgi:hypothetical protein
MAVSLEEGKKLLKNLYWETLYHNDSSYRRVRAFQDLVIASELVTGKWDEDGPAAGLNYDNSTEAIDLLKMYVSDIGLSSSNIPFFSKDTKTIIDNCYKELEGDITPAQTEKLAAAIKTYKLDETPTDNIWVESNHLSTTSKFLSLAAIVATGAFVVHHLKNKA